MAGMVSAHTIFRHIRIIFRRIRHIRITRHIRTVCTGLFKDVGLKKIIYSRMSFPVIKKQKNPPELPEGSFFLLFNFILRGSVVSLLQVLRNLHLQRPVVCSLPCQSG